MPQVLPGHRHHDSRKQWTDGPSATVPQTADKTLYATAADLKVLQDQIDVLKKQSTSGTDPKIRQDVDFLLEAVCPQRKAG
jgi:hypothetical protein